MRINKYLAQCGVSSRRAAEEYIKSGKVSVNDKVVTDLATNIDVRKDKVSFNGKKLSLPNTFTYIMLHKPKGYVCTSSDEKGRKTVFDLIKGVEARLFTIGRLDYDTEGLLLLTDDGNLAQRLTHPSSEIGKTYIVRIDGEMQESQLAALRNGVTLDDGFKTSKSLVRVLEIDKEGTRLEVTIFEGHNRQIKKMFEVMDKKVVFLKRTKIGDLKLGGLNRGAYRELKKHEVEYLQKM